IPKSGLVLVPVVLVLDESAFSAAKRAPLSRNYVAPLFSDPEMSEFSRTNDDDEYPRKPRLFWVRHGHYRGFDLQPSKFEILQAPHCQRDATGDHGERERHPLRHTQN